MGKLVRAKKARMETAAMKDLPHGIYFTKEKPKMVLEDEMDDEFYDDDEDSPTGKSKKKDQYAASLSSYNVNGEPVTYLFKTAPKLLAKARTIEDVIKGLLKVAPKNGKVLSEQGDGETAFLIKTSDGFIAIAFDND